MVVNTMYKVVKLNYFNIKCNENDFYESMYMVFALTVLYKRLNKSNRRGYYFFRILMDLLLKR